MAAPSGGVGTVGRRREVWGGGGGGGGGRSGGGQGWGGGYSGHCAGRGLRYRLHLRVGRQWGRWGWRGRSDGRRWGSVGVPGGEPQARSRKGLASASRAGARGVVAVAFLFLFALRKRVKP